MNTATEITLHLSSINELLSSPNTIHRKKTLKSDAEEFIVEAAETFPHLSVIKMNIHIPLSEAQHEANIGPAIHTHFYYRRDQSQKKYKRVLKYGWRILLIAFGLLAVMFTLIEISLHFMPDNKLVKFISESFIILGWVALWRPLDLLLYDRYPIKRNIKLYYKLEHSIVQVVIEESKNI